jgi:hypothetical protein
MRTTESGSVRSIWTSSTARRAAGEEAFGQKGRQRGEQMPVEESEAVRFDRAEKRARVANIFKSKSESEASFIEVGRRITDASESEELRLEDARESVRRMERVFV